MWLPPGAANFAATVSSRPYLKATREGVAAARRFENTTRRRRRLAAAGTAHTERTARQRPGACSAACCLLKFQSVVYNGKFRLLLPVVGQMSPRLFLLLVERAVEGRPRLMPWTSTHGRFPPMETFCESANKHSSPSFPPSCMGRGPARPCRREGCGGRHFAPSVSASRLLENFRRSRSAVRGRRALLDRQTGGQEDGPAVGRGGLVERPDAWALSERDKGRAERVGLGALQGRRRDENEARPPTRLALRRRKETNPKKKCSETGSKKAHNEGTRVL